VIVIVDYGMGNLKSVHKAVEFLGSKVKISDSPSIIKRASKILFPGVGHFGRAVKELRKRKLYEALKKKIAEGIPFLGICLGMQLLLERSEEAPLVRGLGAIKGKVKKFRGRLVVPHMGWNSVKVQVKEKRKSTRSLFKGIKDNSYFYFAHSYYCQPEEEVVSSTTFYGEEFVSSLHKENIWAVQFHPEKSASLGLKLLENFLKL
jgi:glutamine amidotransferase